MYILAAVVAVVIIGIVLALNSGSNPQVSGPGGMGSSSSTQVTQPGYSPVIPKNTVVTTSTVAVPAAPGVSAQLRVYDNDSGLTMSKSGFNKPYIKVNKGDTTNIWVTAVDADYDIRIPALGMGYDLIKKGEKKLLGVTPSTSGSYTIECDKLCPSSGKISIPFYVE